MKYKFTGTDVTSYRLFMRCCISTSLCEYQNGICLAGSTVLYHHRDTCCPHSTAAQSVASARDDQSLSMTCAATQLHTEFRHMVSLFCPVSLSWLEAHGWLFC